MTGIFWTILFGLLVAESIFFVTAIAKQFVRLVFTPYYQVNVLLLAATSLAVIIALIRESDWQRAKKVAKSKRADHFGAFFLGILISLSFEGIGTSTYEAALSLLTQPQLLLLLWMPPFR